MDAVVITRVLRGEPECVFPHCRIVLPLEEHVKHFCQNVSPVFGRVFDGRRVLTICFIDFQEDWSSGFKNSSVSFLWVFLELVPIQICRRLFRCLVSATWSIRHFPPQPIPLTNVRRIVCDWRVLDAWQVAPIMLTQTSLVTGTDQLIIVNVFILHGFHSGFLFNLLDNWS